MVTYYPMSLYALEKLGRLGHGDTHNTFTPTLVQAFAKSADHHIIQVKTKNSWGQSTSIFSTLPSSFTFRLLRETPIHLLSIHKAKFLHGEKEAMGD